MNNVNKIIVVFKTHFDIGFTDLASNVVAGYGKKMLPDVVKTCNDTQVLGKRHRFLWTMSAWPLLQSLKIEFAEKDIIGKAEDLIRDGQIAWHALPFTTHTEFCGLEEYIRGMFFSLQLTKKYGRSPISAKMTDVPGHTWILPSLLAKAGVKFLHLGCNAGSTSPDVPRLFFWEGPDGGRVLVFYNKGGYGSAVSPPADWNLPVWLALMNTGDNHGPQNSESIQKILNQVEEEMPGTDVVVGTLDDFYNSVLPYLNDIPVIRKDLADTWIHGVGSYPYEVGQLRNARHILSDAEKALSMGMIHNVFPGKSASLYKEEISRAYENGILFGEHTWGLDVKSTIGVSGRIYKKKGFLSNKHTPQYERLAESWREKSDKALAVKSFSEKTAPAIMNILAGSINIEGERIIVFNGLGWKRNGYFKIGEYLSNISGKKLLDTSTGENIEIRSYQKELCAYVKDIPAFGYKTLIVSDIKADCSGRKSIKYGCQKGKIENRWFSIEVDSKFGTIKSLIEKSSGREWIDSKQLNGFAQYRYDILGTNDITEFIRAYSYRFSDWLVNDLGRAGYPEQEHLSYFPENFNIDIEEAACSQSLILSTCIKDRSVVDYGNAKQLTTTITIYDDMPYIDLDYKLEGKEENWFVESGYFTFSLNLKDPEIRINKLGSVIDPSKDIPRNANNGLYCCENWVDISDNKDGMLIIPYDTPLFSIGQPTIYKFVKEYEKQEPIIYFNCFNNSWGTNFPQWIGGDLQFRYRLIPHRGDWQRAEAWKHALESVTHILSGYALGKSCSTCMMPLEQELMMSPDGILIQAFKPAENGDGFILRLREMKGETRKVEMKLPGSFKSATKCDLLERIEENFPVNANKIEFVTNPFEIHSFYLKGYIG